MISPAMARQLVSTSASTLERHMAAVNKAVTAAATNGFNKVALYADIPWESEPVAKVVEPTAEQQRIIVALKALGYGAALQQHGSTYVPLGMVDSEGNGPLYINWAIMVSWNG